MALLPHKLATMQEELEKLHRKEVLDDEEYIKLVDAMFDGIIGKENWSEVATRASQDSSAAKKHLLDRVLQDIHKALSIYAEMEIQSVGSLTAVLDKNSSLQVLQCVKQQLKSNQNTKFNLYLLISMLNTFEYAYKEVQFLVSVVYQHVEENSPLVLVVVSRLISMHTVETENEVIECCEVSLIQEELVTCMAFLSVIYPAMPTLASRVFLGVDFQQVLQKNIKTSSSATVLKGLRLFSIACVDENAREYIAENFYDMLCKGAGGSGEVAVLSSLVVVKTWNFLKLRDITMDTLTTSFINNIGSFKEHCLEGLAYLSLKSNVKHRIREELGLDLVTMMKEANTSELYGLSVIMSNVTTYNEHLTQDQLSTQKLQQYAQLKQPGETETDNDEEVSNFIDDILELGIISHFQPKFFASCSHGVQNQVVRILFNCVHIPKNRASVIQQGGLVLVLEALINKLDCRDVALRCLAQLLVSTDPHLAFHKYSPLTAIGFLFEQLNAKSSKQVFESFVALTNLATLNDDVRKALLDKWPLIEPFIIDDNAYIQRSCLELVSNMMELPMTSVKFFNFQNPASVKNFDILLKLLKLPDLKSQCAVAAILANGTMIPFIAQELATNAPLWDSVLSTLEEQPNDHELAHRLVLAMYNIIAEGTTNVPRNRILSTLTKVQPLGEIGEIVTEIVHIFKSQS